MPQQRVILPQQRSILLRYSQPLLHLRRTLLRLRKLLLQPRQQPAQLIVAAARVVVGCPFDATRSCRRPGTTSAGVCSSRAAHISLAGCRCTPISRAAHSRAAWSTATEWHAPHGRVSHRTLAIACIVALVAVESRRILVECACAGRVGAK